MYRGQYSSLVNVHSKHIAQKQRGVYVSHHLSPLFLSQRLRHISNTAVKDAMFMTLMEKYSPST